jgi:hypothetical protein
MKYTKHKYNIANNNTLNNHSFLTSKNNNKLIYDSSGGRYVRKNNTINKHIKKTRTSLPLGTFKRLNKYGMIDIYTQDGGFISKLKFHYNLNKILNIIEKLGKYQIKLTEYFDSYENETKHFKYLGDEKAKAINDKLRTKKSEIIYKFVMNNMSKEYDVKTSNLEKDLELIQNKYIGIDNTIDELNRQIKKEQKKYEVFFKSFNKQSKIFNKVIKKYEQVKGFYIEQKVLKEQYMRFEGQKKLSKDDQKLKKKYITNKKGIEKVLAYGEDNIEKHKSEKDNLSTILDKSKTYKEAYDNINYNNYDKDIINWETKYKKIYEDIIGIDKKMSDIKKVFDKLNEYTEIIKRELNIIYKTIGKANQLDSINKILLIFKNNEILLSKVKELIKKIKLALIQENEVDDIISATSYAESYFNAIENNFINLKQDLIRDKNEIKDDIENSYEPKKLGGGGAYNSNNLSDINTFAKFLDSGYEQIFNILEAINNELADGNKTSQFYKLSSEENGKIIQIYFNIYMFFLYYDEIRGDTFNPDEEQKCNLNIDLNINNKEIIKWFIKLDKIYKKINKDNKIKTYNDLDDNYQYYIDTYKNKDNIVDKLTTFLNKVKDKIETYFKTIINDKDSKIFNVNNDKTEKIINLVYQYNTNIDTNIKIFKGFYGIDTNIQNLKKSCNITEYKHFFDKDYLHNDINYKDSFIIYSEDNTNFNFYSVYNDENPDVKIKKVSKYDEIKQKYEEFEEFIKNQIKKITFVEVSGVGKTKKQEEKQNETKKDEEINKFKDNLKKLSIDKTTINFNDGYIKDIDFKKKLKDMLNKISPNNVDSITEDNLEKFRDKIIKEWEDKINVVKYEVKGGESNIGSILDLYCGNNLDTYTDLGTNNEPLFNNAVTHFRDFLNEYIYPNILKNIYNNIKYENNYKNDELDINTTFSKTIINNNKSLVLYKEDIDYVKTEITKNSNIIKYIYSWLYLNKDILDDCISGCIKKMNDIKTTVLDNDAFDFDKNKIMSSFLEKFHKGNFIQECKELDREVDQDTDFMRLIEIITTKPSLQKIQYSETIPIPPQTEKRLDVKNPEGTIKFINKPEPEVSGKHSFPSIKNYRVIPKEYKNETRKIHRIVCFNINFWKTINQTPEDNIYTNPSYAIDFLENIKDIDALCLLNYTLHNDIKTSSGGYFIYNNNIKQIQYGGVDLMPRNVSNEYIKTEINKKLKLEMKYIENDNINNKIYKDILPLPNDIFLGKALYSKNQNNIDQYENFDITYDNQRREKICKIEYKIGSNIITIYFVNFKNDYNNNNIIYLEKEKTKALLDYINNKGIKYYIIMGNFNSIHQTDGSNQSLTEKYKLTQIGGNNITFYNGKTYDLCYVSNDFRKLYKIMNINNITIPSGEVSSHYPIYIDIIVKNEDSSSSSSQSSIVSSSTSKNNNLGNEGKQLLSTFLKDTYNIPNLEKNKKVLVDRILEMINTINRDLKPEKFKEITNNINTIGQNQIELRLIEKNLTPSSIKEYNKISIDYKWINDIVKSEKEKINLTSTTKEVSKLLNTIPQVKGLVTSSSLSREDILDIISKINDRNYTPKDEKYKNLLSKLGSNDNSAKLMIEEIEKGGYEDITKCIILSKLQIYATNKLFSEAFRNIPGNTSQNCESVLKQKADSKKQQQYQGKQY